MPLLCSFCGSEAKYYLGNSQYCCLPNSSECPSNINRFNEESKKLEILEYGVPLEVLNVAGYRSTPAVNENNDMVQVTLRMKKYNWTVLQKVLKQKS